MKHSQEKRKPGPDPERLSLEGDWEEAIDRAMKKHPSKSSKGANTDSAGTCKDGEPGGRSGESGES